LTLAFLAGQTAETERSTSPSAPVTKSYADYDHLDPLPAGAADADEPATTGGGGEQPQPREEENVEERVTVTADNDSKSCCIML